MTRIQVVNVNNSFRSIVVALRERFNLDRNENSCSHYETQTKSEDIKRTQSQKVNQSLPTHKHFNYKLSAFSYRWRSSSVCTLSPKIWTKNETNNNTIEVVGIRKADI